MFLGNIFPEDFLSIYTVLVEQTHYYFFHYFLDLRDHLNFDHNVFWIKRLSIYRLNCAMHHLKILWYVLWSLNWFSWTENSYYYFAFHTPSIYIVFGSLISLGVSKVLEYYKKALDHFLILSNWLWIWNCHNLQITPSSCCNTQNLNDDAVKQQCVHHVYVLGVDRLYMKSLITAAFNDNNRLILIDVLGYWWRI